MKTAAFETDLATLAVFDPKALLHRMREPRDWWQAQSQLDLPEVLEGAIALFPIGDEGTFGVRLTLDVASPLLEPTPRADASAASLRVPRVVRRSAPTRAPSERGRAAPTPILEEDEGPPPPPSYGPFEYSLVRRAFKEVIDADRLPPAAAPFA